MASIYRAASRLAYTLSPCSMSAQTFNRFSMPAKKLSCVSAIWRPVVLSAASDPSTGPKSQLVERLKGDMKTAMKAKDQVRLDCIRFVNAAIKSREIELRESNKEINDDEVLKVLQKLSKQRKDSIESYRAGGREDLAEKEQVELSIMEAYLPQQMSQQEVEALVALVVSELGANSVKNMGAVMKVAKERAAGRADNKLLSDAIKAKLQG